MLNHCSWWKQRITFLQASEHELPQWFSGKESACQGLIPGSGRSAGIGNGNLLQYCCLGNPMDRGAGQATVHRWQKESDATYSYDKASGHNISPTNQHVTLFYVSLFKDNLFTTHHWLINIKLKAKRTTTHAWMKHISIKHITALLHSERWESTPGPCSQATLNGESPQNPTKCEQRDAENTAKRTPVYSMSLRRKSIVQP